MQSFALILFAVHIPDGGFLKPSWLLGGFVAAGLLAGGALLIDMLLGWVRGRELGEEEIARLALLTAVFFVASNIAVPVPAGFTTTHLLLNGLLGIVLRWRAALAIPVALLLQAALLHHGGFSTLGVNSCVMEIPALVGWGLFAALHRLPCLTHPWFRGLLVCLCVMVCVLGVTFCAALALSNNLASLNDLETSWARDVTFNPLTLVAAVAVGIFCALLERRLENAPEFPLGLFVGIVCVQLTMLLNALVLVYGGTEDWRSVALLTFVAHIPVSLIEGLVLGCVVGFLARVKPELLGWRQQQRV